MLFLTDFAGDLALDAADDPFAAFDFGAYDAEAVEGNRGLLWLLRLLRLLGSLRFARRIGGRGGLIGTVGSGININVERRHRDVRLNGSVSALEFDGLFDPGHGIDGATEDIGFGVAAYVAGGLLDFQNLRLALEAVEQKYSGVFGEAESGGHLRQLGFLQFAFLFEFLVELRGFGDGGSGGAIFLIFLGGRPVDQRVGEFFPIIAFGAEVADAVAFDLIFRDQLVGAVFENQTAGKILGGRGKREQEQERREQQPLKECSCGTSWQSQHTFSNYRLVGAKESNSSGSQFRGGVKKSMTTEDTEDETEDDTEDAEECSGNHLMNRWRAL